MELVQNAFFTDPSDQSAWFYHRWLLGRAENELTLLDISENAGRLALTFSHPVKVLSDDKGQGQTWLNPIGTKYCHTWYTRETAVNDVTVDHGGLSHVFSLSDHVTDGSTNVRGSYFRHEMTAATSDVLSQELESCQQLFELEPDNKWVLLTIVLLMKSLDAAAYKEQIMSNLDKLSQVDSYRKYYYLDLRTKFLWEESIMSLGLATELSLRSCAVTKLNYAQLLCGLTHLDLSHNHLRSVSGVYCMQRLKELDVSNNMITSASPIQHMACLEIVNLENNAIKDPECEEKMKRTCQALRLVVLDGNPLDSS